MAIETQPGFALLTQVGAESSLAVLVAGSVIYSLGLCPVVILATDLVVGSAPVERAGAASAISEAGSELGGALGVAILGSIGTAVYRSLMVGASPVGVPAEVMEVARRTLGGAVAVAEPLAAPMRAGLLEAARGAFTQAFELTAGICAALALESPPS
jgi:DHA2 family multidrug resistance protein-like MFS transporter